MYMYSVDSITNLLHDTSLSSPLGPGGGPALGRLKSYDKELRSKELPYIIGARKS